MNYSVLFDLLSNTRQRITTEFTNENNSPLIYWFGVLTGSIILLLNIPILWTIWKERILTWINQLICLDCILCIGMIPIVLSLADVFPLPCSFISSYAFFASLLNRLLPVGIVIFRYIYVCRSSWVNTANQRRIFHLTLSITMLMLVALLTLGSWMYNDKYLHYLTCIGEQDTFLHSNEQVDGFAWLLPIYHPFHFISILAFFLYSVMVPLGYFLIYLFRKKDNYEVSGLNERSRLIRKHRNIVTTKFNMMNWMFEISGFIVLIPGERTFSVLYFLITCTISPVLYYVASGLNRLAAKRRILALFKDLNTGLTIINIQNFN